MADESPDSSPLDRLGARLEAARARERSGGQDERGASGASRAALALGFRIVTEVVAAVGVGALIGYGLDHWLGSTPWLMVLFLFLGSASGVLNAYRAARHHEVRRARDGRKDG